MLVRPQCCLHYKKVVVSGQEHGHGAIILFEVSSSGIVRKRRLDDCSGIRAGDQGFEGVESP